MQSTGQTCVRAAVASVLLLAVAPAPGAHAGDFLPLQPGNAWIYEGVLRQRWGTSRDTVAVELTEDAFRDIGGATHFALPILYPPDALFREDDDGNIWWHRGNGVDRER
jgi:hypothetical protein